MKRIWGIVAIVIIVGLIGGNLIQTAIIFASIPIFIIARTLTPRNKQFLLKFLTKEI